MTAGETFDRSPGLFLIGQNRVMQRVRWRRRGVSRRSPVNRSALVSTLVSMQNPLPPAMRGRLE